VAPVAQGYTYQEMPYYAQTAQSVPVDYVQHGQFKEVMMVDHGHGRLNYMGPRYNDVVSVEAYTAQEEEEPAVPRSKKTVQRSAPPPRSSGPSSEEDEAPIKFEKKKAQRSAAPAAAVSPLITYVDHEEPKYRTVAVEQDVLISKNETINVEKIKFDERVVNVDRVKVET
jgi:hypothetical protein